MTNLFSWEGSQFIRVLFLLVFVISKTGSLGNLGKLFRFCSVVLSCVSFLEARDQPEPGSSFPRSILAGMIDPGNEVTMPHNGSHYLVCYFSSEMKLSLQVIPRHGGVNGARFNRRFVYSR